MMRQRPPNIAPVWIAVAFALCIGTAITGIHNRLADRSFPAAVAITPQQAGVVMRDFAGLHPPGDNPWP